NAPRRSNFGSLRQGGPGMVLPAPVASGTNALGRGEPPLEIQSEEYTAVVSQKAWDEVTVHANATAAPSRLVWKTSARPAPGYDRMRVIKQSLSNVGFLKNPRALLLVIDETLCRGDTIAPAGTRLLLVDAATGLKIDMPLSREENRNIGLEQIIMF